MSILGITLRSLATTAIFLLHSVLSTLAASLILSAIQQWDGAPGDGIVVMMVLAWTLLVALAFSIVLFGTLCDRRRQPELRYPWKEFVASILGITAAPLLPVAFFLFVDNTSGTNHRGSTYASLCLLGAASLTILMIRIFQPSRNSNVDQQS